MKILGISAFYHDSAAAIIENGTIIAAAQEERFSRIKHDREFPKQAVRYCLEEAGCELNELDAIAFYDKPFLKFERLLETYYSFAPRGVKSFITAMPVWLKEKMFLKRLIHQELETIGNYNKKESTLLFPEHHLSHAASAYFSSPFNESAILTIDGVGEWATATICHGKGNEITILKELRFPHSVGLLYSAFTYYLGFRVNSGEYKLMGLAPYGNPESGQTKQFIKTIKESLASVYDDGSVWLNQEYFKYATGLQMTNDEKWEQLFEIKRREPESQITPNHCNLAFAIQKVTEEILLKMAITAKKETGSKHLCLAGGVALNCVANFLIHREKLFDQIFIQPAAGDAGGALGAAQAAYYIYFGKEKTTSVNDAMQGAYLGPEISEAEIKKLAIRYGLTPGRFSGDAERSEKTTGWVADGQVVGWVQGRMEFGPRALGNRSILADPRNPKMQEKLNLEIKNRESFRPFAPAVLEEEASRYFDLESPSPYMLLTAPVKEEHRKPLPHYYRDTGWKTMLRADRSALPGITHVDFSARVQTVNKETNPAFYNLIEAFGKRTGVPVLINTSFNLRGEPIVCNAVDAYRCFMESGMDKLVIGDYYFEK